MREDDASGFSSSVSLNKDCTECVDILVTGLAAVYAGARSTKNLTPIFHDPRDAQYDDWDIANLFRQLPFPDPQRKTLIGRGQALAINIVIREAKAIQALAHALEAAGGFLSGEDASKIINENLVSSALQG